jgi:hypothetical protein
VIKHLPDLGHWGLDFDLFGSGFEKSNPPEKRGSGRLEREAKQATARFLEADRNEES